MGIVGIINKIFKTEHRPPDWVNEDRRLPVWVRKAVSKWKKNNSGYETGSKKIFFGKKYVYKFTWWAELTHACHDRVENDYIFKEKWVREIRR
jgi:hypothetical protein